MNLILFVTIMLIGSTNPIYCCSMLSCKECQLNPGCGILVTSPEHHVSCVPGNQLGPIDTSHSVSSWMFHSCGNICNHHCNTLDCERCTCRVDQVDCISQEFSSNGQALVAVCLVLSCCAIAIGIKMQLQHSPCQRRRCKVSTKSRSDVHTIEHELERLFTHEYPDDR